MGDVESAHNSMCPGHMPIHLRRPVGQSCYWVVGQDIDNAMYMGKHSYNLIQDNAQEDCDPTASEDTGQPRPAVHTNQSQNNAVGDNQ